MVNNSTNINKTNNHLYFKPLNNRDTTFTSGNSGPDFGQTQNKLMLINTNPLLIIGYPTAISITNNEQNNTKASEKTGHVCKIINVWEKLVNKK